MKRPYIFKDLRALESYEDRALYDLNAEELNRILPLSRKIPQFLKRVRGLSVGDGTVSLVSGKEKQNIISIVKALDSWAADTHYKALDPITPEAARKLLNR